MATLTDTGPLVALINRNDPNHKRCLDLSRRMPSGPLLTTWPCFTEAMYLAHRAGGYPAQTALWTLRTTQRLVIHDLTAPEVDRIETLMGQYRDTPMDLADASIVVVAESLHLRRVFALDSDFYAYRLADRSALEVVPGPSS
jgi:predicted nucleic acid-binding protein